MALLETWRKLAYETEMNQNQATQFWGNYFNLEKGIYEQILSTPDEPVSGTVKELPQWDNLLDEAKRKELYKKQKLSGTVIKGKKIGRNEPCPCGSGKKYKNCCGKNA